MSDCDVRLSYAQKEAEMAGLSSDQQAGMIAFLLGAVLTNFDEDPPIKLTDSRWERLVQAAVIESQ